MRGHKVNPLVDSGVEFSHDLLLPLGADHAKCQFGLVDGVLRDCQSRSGCYLMVMYSRRYEKQMSKS